MTKIRMKKETAYYRVIAYFFQYWKTIAWLAIVFFMSTMKIPLAPGVPLINIPHFDKIIHFSLYFILVSIWMIDDYKKTKFFKGKNLVVIVILSVLYGGLMEILQKIVVQDRSGDILDVLANTVGVLVAFLLFKNISFYRNILLKIFSANYKSYN